MERIIKLKNGARHKWNGLPSHHRAAVASGFLVTVLLIIVGVNLLSGKLRAANAPLSSVIFRVLVEQGIQRKYLILRGNIVGSTGKVCFAKLENAVNKDCPIEFPVVAWSDLAVRTELSLSTPVTGKIWLVNGEGIKSNELEVSF